MQPSKKDLLLAMAEFDRQYRRTRSWLKWEENQAHKYAIEESRVLYPVKRVISLATGVPVSELHGGPGRANAIVDGAGLRIVRLHST